MATSVADGEAAIGMARTVKFVRCSLLDATPSIRIPLGRKTGRNRMHVFTMNIAGANTNRSRDCANCPVTVCIKL